MRRTFRPPRTNPLVVGFVKAITPLLFKLAKVERFEIPEEDFARLKSTRGKRMLLLPNHPTGFDPAVLFEIANRLRETFNNVAARELFEWNRGVMGWTLQRVGVYSIIRGIADRESFRTTKNILVEGKNRLVIFIEGEISSENDTLIPFEPGVIQLAFWAQEELVRKAREEAGGQSESIYLVPVAIKYFYHPGVQKTLSKSLARLEQYTGLPVSPAEDWPDLYARIRRVSEKVLNIQESMLNLTPDPGATLDERIALVRHRLLVKMESFLEVKPPEDASFLERVRQIRYQMDRRLYSYEDIPAGFSQYELRMLDHLKATFTEFYADLRRLVNFMTLSESCLQERMSPERFVDVVRHLEKEVYGKAKISHPRTVMARIGEFCDLAAYFDEYEQDKKQTPQRLAEALERNMAELLKGMYPAAQAAHIQVDPGPSEEPGPVSPSLERWYPGSGSAPRPSV